MSLSNTQYDAIIKKYEDTQSRNRYLLDKRVREVYDKLPEYKELDQSVGSLSIAQARLALDGDTNAIQRLRQSLADLSARKRELLVSAGYPADYLAPIYTCALCQDTGYITDSRGIKAKCRCFTQQEIALLYEQSNIREMVKRENFSTLSYEYYQGEDLDRFTKCVKICQNFVQNFEQDYRNLFFYGTVGTGKSFLSGCIAGELLEKGQAVIYFSATGLFDSLARYSFDAKSKDALYSFCKDLYDCDLLIIDDLGTEVTNSFVASQLFSLLNERHLRRKATIISTNLSLEELRDRYSDRVFSRIISNYTVCKLTGPDIRMYKKRNN